MVRHCPHCERPVPASSTQLLNCPACNGDLAATEQHERPAVREAATLAPREPEPAIVHEAATLPPPHVTPVDYEAATLAPDGSVTPLPAEIPEQIVGGYLLLRKLGEGGMGSVYEAEEIASGQHVAVKLISPGHALSDDAVKRFRKEGRLASTLDHPRCVFVLSADIQGGVPYIAMELMPGDTLQDLVDRKQRLSWEEAVTKIIDAMDGLAEAHRLGIVHRDIKPSNCFLEKDGHVKIGDFGLAKALISEEQAPISSALTGDEQSTKQGAFLGTPLYASPEQIKRERLDPRSDVYSMAATLYCLLAGHAPFQTGDSLSTMARIVSDSVPPLRGIRPDVPAALEKVILRGLERARERRWQSIGAFRDALAMFLSAQSKPADVGLRIAAYMIIDGIPLWVLREFITTFVLFFALQFADLSQPHGYLVPMLPSLAVGMAIYLLYFTISEGCWGCSPGKLVFRLRVRATDNGPCGIMRALARCGCQYVLLNFTYGVGLLLPMLAEQWDLSGSVVIGGLALTNISPLLGLVLIVSTMRQRNGYRGLHEFLSGTRVVRIRPRPRQKAGRSNAFRRSSGREMRASMLRRRANAQAPISAIASQEVTVKSSEIEHVGPFEVRKALDWNVPGRMLLARDAALDRKLLIWLRSPDIPGFRPARRQVSRSTRLRWVAAGREISGAWDAFTLPEGRPLSEVVAQEGRATWAKTRPILEQLSNELAAAVEDESLPDTLLVDQVWLTRGGDLQLLDFPCSMGPAPGEVRVGGETPTLLQLVKGDLAGEAKESAARRAIGQVRGVATLLLEGRPRRPDDWQRPICAPLPRHAARMMNRLIGLPETAWEKWLRSAGKRSFFNRPLWELFDRKIVPTEGAYEEPRRLCEDLEKTEDRYTAVTHGLRALQVLKLESLFLFGVLIAIMLPALQMGSEMLGVKLLLVNIPLGLLVVWSFMTRGALFRPYYMTFAKGTRLNLVTFEGRRPSRFRAALRSILIWSPFSLLLSLVALTGGEFLPLNIVCLVLCGVLGVVATILAVVFPEGWLPDWLAGTRIVPD
jgi:hypothetical protein